MGDRPRHVCFAHVGRFDSCYLRYWQMLRFFRVEHCYSNRRRLPLIGQRGARRYRCHLGGNDREVSCCVFLCRAPSCTCHGDFFKTRGTREIHSRLGYPPGRAEPLVVSPELLHPHYALRQELLPFLVHNRGIAVKFRRSLLDNPH